MAPPHGYVTAWEVDDEQEPAPVGETDRRVPARRRPTVPDDRYAVPWALPDE